MSPRLRLPVARVVVPAEADYFLELVPSVLEVH